MMEINILVLDSNKDRLAVLCNKIKLLGYNSIASSGIDEGIKKLNEEKIDIAFLNSASFEHNSHEILMNMANTSSAPEVILISESGYAAGADLAIQNGVWDFINNDDSMSMLSIVLFRTVRYRKAKYLSKCRAVLSRSGFVGHTPLFVEALNKIAGAAENDYPVLITGEPGTGKDLAAQIMHNNSIKCRGNFVVLDTSLIKKSELETALFGAVHDPAAGKKENKQISLVKQADKGTLFIDEIADIPLLLQGELLNVVKDKHYSPVGSTTRIKSDFRLIAATNKDIDILMSEGKFRKDLYHLFDSFNIEMPPLRKRTDDLQELLSFYIYKICRQYNKQYKGFTTEFLDWLSAYHWPGNIKEFKNILERAILICGNDPVLIPAHLPDTIKISIAKTYIKRKKSENSVQQKDQKMPTIKEFKAKCVKDLEKDYLIKLMAEVDGNINKACQTSGVGRARLYDLLKKYKIPTS